MFESLVSNIKRRFSKNSVSIAEDTSKTDKSGIKRSLYAIRAKLSVKSELQVSAVGGGADGDTVTVLSPRATGSAECARTDVSWPALAEHNPSALDRFTCIVSRAPDSHTKRNDREEIRKRLAMGVESDEYYSLGHVGSERPSKKPSLHTRLQSGKNLQICFMNETASDSESQASDVERNSHAHTHSGSSRSLSKSSIFSKSNYSLNNHPYQTRPLSVNTTHPYQTRLLSVNTTQPDKLNAEQSGPGLRPTSLSLKSSKTWSTSQTLGPTELRESDFQALQSTLQTEARVALAQAKEMARLQMERSRAARAASPVSLVVRRSLQLAAPAIAAPAAAAPARRLSRRLLTGMVVAQLQVIVNALHGEIAALSESLVRLLMARDELHMGQDSMLVDIEDLTRYLGVKQTKKGRGGRSARQ